MGYTIPEGVDTMLDVVGVGWPNVDEDAYRDMADALREFADDADDDAHTAHGHIQRLLSTGQSESLTALDTHWKKVQAKNKDLAGAARLIAGALDRIADIIVARKIAAVAELADLCATVGIALAAAPFTMGLTALLAGGKIVATRIAFKRILKEMAEAAVAEITAILTQPAVAALESIVTDLVIQTAMNVTGQQDGINVDQSVQAGKDSLQLNSAGGGTAPGGSLGIDHDAHSGTGGKLVNVQVSMNTRAATKIGKAKGHHGRAKGKDSSPRPSTPPWNAWSRSWSRATTTSASTSGRNCPTPSVSVPRTTRTPTWTSSSASRGSRAATAATAEGSTASSRRRGTRAVARRRW